MGMDMDMDMGMDMDMCIEHGHVRHIYLLLGKAG